ncbi:MAG: hypothetical protein RLZZ557_1043 [Bacteroidota bacterium]
MECNNTQPNIAMKNLMLTGGLLFLLSHATFAQTVAKFKISLDRPTNGLTVPAHINLDELSFQADSNLTLLEVDGNKKMAIPYQISQENQRTLYWNISATDKKEISYELVNAPKSSSSTVQAIKNDSSITINQNGKNLLRYYHAKVNPPIGQHPYFARSGFIHPLWTPRGQELTRIQAPDHYHHYGVWNAWTHVLFEKDTVDFWNIRGHQGTVRFAKMISKNEGSIFSEFEALQEHVVFKKDGTEKVALNELLTVRVYPQLHDDYYIVDITSKMNCATDSPFRILEYRYAGFGWRTTAYWDNNNCEVLTSEGKTRKDTDNSRAKWCIVQGQLPGNEFGGAAFLSHPSNFNFPEPMRIWTLNTNGRGDMFFSFAPTKDRDWLLEPGNTYVIKYRLVVFNGKFDAAKAESAWQYYQKGPAIRINPKLH